MHLEIRPDSALDQANWHHLQNLLAREIFTPIYAEIPDFMKVFTKPLEAIQRFRDSGVKDNVLDHIRRSVGMAKKLESGITVENTLWVHDLAEQITGDTPVLLQKEDDGNAELMAIHQIVPRQFIPLALDFFHTQRFLKGKEEHSSYVTENAVLANAVDRTEGNTHFHRWQSSQGSRSQKHDDYTFNEINKFTQRLVGLEGSKIQTAISLLNLQKTYMIHLYGQIE